MTVFVPAHRCGAVPDSDRVPSYVLELDSARATASINKITRFGWGVTLPPSFAAR